MRGLMGLAPIFVGENWRRFALEGIFARPPSAIRPTLAISVANFDGSPQPQGPTLSNFRKDFSETCSLSEIGGVVGY